MEADAVSPRVEHNPERIRRALLTLGGIWLALALADLAAAFGVERSALRDGRLDTLERSSLLAVELLVSLLVLGVCVVVGVALERLRSRIVAGKAQRALGIFGIGIVWLLTLAWGASWALFWSVGSFLDLTSLRLFWMGSLQLVKHLIEMNPVRLVALPLGTLLVVLLVARGLRALPGRIGERSDRVLSLGALFVVTTLFTLVLYGELVAARTSRNLPETASGARFTSGEIYRHARAYRAGPISHLLVALESPNEMLAAETRTARASKLRFDPAPIPIEYRPILPLSQYVAGVDRAKLQRFNVIVLLVESLRPDVLEAFAGKRKVMPELDALAVRSRRFKRSYAQSSHSDYADLCPLSSHYPLRSQEHHYYPERPSYPRVLIYDVLQALGWRTAIVSSQNERWGNMLNYLQTGGIDHLFHSETFHQTVVDAEDTVFSQWVKQFKHSGKIDDRDTVTEAIRWIGENERPFFMYLNLQNSHFPYRTPEHFPKRFSPHEIDFSYSFGSYPKDKVGVVRNRYDNSLSYIDAQLGRLLQVLANRRALERTILVVTGDNGQGFFEHDAATHAGPLYEEAVRVPLVVHAPALSPGDDERLAQHVDVPPTIFSLLGLPPHPAFQGIDLTRPDPEPQRSAYLVVQTAVTRQIALVRDNFKLVYDFAFGRYFLYDLERDPFESHDLSVVQPAALAVLAGRLEAWQKAQLDYYSAPERHTRVYPPVLAEATPAP